MMMTTFFVSSWDTTLDQTLTILLKVYFQHRWLQWLQKSNLELFIETGGDWFNKAFSKFLEVCLQQMDPIAPEFTCGNWLHKTRAFKIPKSLLQHMDRIAPKSTCGDWLHKTRAFRSSWTCYHLAILFWGELSFQWSFWFTLKMA